MGFMDQLKKLTQPYDEEDDFFEGSDESLRAKNSEAVDAQKTFEETFASGGRTEAPEPENAPEKEQSSGLFGNLGVRRAAKAASPRRERTVNFGGSDTQVILFNPKSFDEAGELVSHLNQSRSVVMTLEGLPTETARRLLDFMSGIAYALQGKITPISAKTYFVTPQNVDVVNSQSQAESGGDYL